MTETWDELRAFALGYPHAIEDFPWGEPVIKIDHPPLKLANGLARGPMFLWLGQREVPEPVVSVKLEASRDEAMEVGRATPLAHSGLGQWGWLMIPLVGADLRLLRDWIDESYRIVAPKKIVAELDAR